MFYDQTLFQWAEEGLLRPGCTVYLPLFHSQDLRDLEEANASAPWFHIHQTDSLANPLCQATPHDMEGVNDHQNFICLRYVPENPDELHRLVENIVSAAIDREDMMERMYSQAAELERALR